MNKKTYIERAEEILGHTSFCGLSESDKCICEAKKEAQALYQLHIEGVREIIGKDERKVTKIDFLVQGHLGAKCRNNLRAEQREKLKK